MEARALSMLARIGDQLDKHVFPYVANGGLVLLNEHAVPSTLSTEISDGREKQRGSAAGSRQGPPGWEGASRRPRSTSATTQVVGADPEPRYETELGGLGKQYPGAQFSRHEHGVWLLTKSGLLPGIREHAIFLTGISFSERVVRSWAFWGDPLAYPVWIGPRHTNFPDGSLCAFEPADDTWRFGQSLVTLLDLFTVWGVRHLYLREFGRWPGYQSIHFPGERILELRPDEHCGCANSEKLYGECCMPGDLAGNQIAHCLNFFRQAGGCRKPPEAVVDYVRFHKRLPDLTNLVTAFAPSCAQLS